MKILYTAALEDSSGYAEAARNYVAALSLCPEIELSCKVVSFEQWKTNLGKYSDILKKVINKPIKPDVQIIHLTPENFSRYRIPGIKNIGMTVWETTKLPEEWVAMCNQMDSIIVPCEWNVKIFKNSGVTVPVYCIHHTIDQAEFKSFINIENLAIPKDKYNFYSIFQWSARKNPEGLIAAYLNEFNYDEPVNLVLKTYLNDNSIMDRNRVIELINKIKTDLQLQGKKTPSITLLHSALSRDEILSLHNQCDCFVLPHRAEGWGVPHFEALAMSKPIITSNYSGTQEFLFDNTNESNFLIGGFETPVIGMNRSTYNGKAKWFEPNLDELSQGMRSYFNSKIKNNNGSDAIENYSWEKVSNKLIGVL